MKTAESKTVSPIIQRKAAGSFFKKGNESFFVNETTVEQSPFFNTAKSNNRSNNGKSIQTKLTIGQPNDKYEQEADAMADKVVQRMSAPDIHTKKETAVQAKPIAATITPLVQTKCATCEQEEKIQEKKEEGGEEELKKIQRKPVFESNTEPPDDENNIQRKCTDCENEKKLQTKSASSDATTAASADIESNLNSSKGGGSPIPDAAREQMEGSFGADFSNVHIHTDSSAVQMNKDLSAQAFTHGSDIYFNSGKYDTNSTSGKHLLAHELTHTVQQGAIIKRKVVPDLQRQHFIEVELVGPVNSYTIAQTGEVINVGEAVGARILINIVLGFGGTVTLTWYNFALNITETGNIRTWLYLKSFLVFFSNQSAFNNLSSQLTATQWRSLGSDPLARLLEMHEARTITIPDEVLISSYKGMIYVEAKAALDRNEASIDELLDASDRVQQIQDYADGLKEASQVRDTLETKKRETEREIAPRIAELEHSLTQAHSFTFGFAGNFQNMDPYQRLRLIREEEEVRAPVRRIEQALDFWNQAFPLLTRLKTNEINSATVESKLREIKANIVATRPRLDDAIRDRGSIDLMELMPIRESIGIRFGRRATSSIAAEDSRRGRNAMIGGTALFVAGILLLFVPGGIFIDAAIGVAIAAKSINDAVIFGQAANTGVHVDDGLMTQGQARMAEFNAVLSTIFAAIGVAAAGFRVLRIGVAFSRVSSAAPELTVGSRMNLARTMAQHPQLITTFRRTTQELEQELGRLNIRLRYEEMQGLRAAMYRFHRIPVVSTSRESLEAFLQRVWNARRTISDENAVYRLYSAATEANPLNLTNAEYLSEIQRIINARPAGSISNIQGAAASGFHRFLRPGLTDAQLLELASANRIAERIYLNTGANHSTEVMGFVVREIVDNPGRFPGVAMAKLTGPASVSRRADAIVIYCETQTAAQNVLQRIREYQRLNPTFFQRTAPPMTLQVMEGIGLASEPLGVAGSASFGGTRSASIFTALRNVTARGGSQQEFMEEVFNILRQRGFNPDAPHLNLPASTPALPPSGGVQPKLETGGSYDLYEQEADAMADKVVQKWGNSNPIQNKQISSYKQKENPQTKTDSSTQNTNENIANGLGSLKGTGSPIPLPERKEMENSLGADFSDVRIHNDNNSAQMNKDLHAQAFTNGNDIYFNSGKYNTNTISGKHLLAHELTHVVQQNTNTIVQREPDTSGAAPEGSCPTYEPDEIVKSRTADGWLPQDVTEHTTDELLFADFGNNFSSVKRNALTEALWVSWKTTFLTDGSYRIQIIGYSDCSGNEEVNTSIRHARALNIERVFGTGITNKLSFRGMSALGQMVSGNETPENRAKNRSVIIRHKQGFFFDTEAFENATQSNTAIQAALNELSSSAEARERNVPAYVAARGITIEPMTPRHDSLIITPTINFFTGTSSYAQTFTRPASVRFHIYNSNANIAIQARNMPDIAGMASSDQIKERIVQAISEVAHLTAEGTAAANTIEQYKAQFNSWWPIAPYNTMDTEFNRTLDSFGPRTNRAREIFRKIYTENATVKNDYDNNTGGIKEKIDTYNIPEGFNLINSPRLQALREVFSANIPPIFDAGYPAFKSAIEMASATLDSDDRNAVMISNDWQRIINQYVKDETKRQEIRNAITTAPVAPALPPAPPTPAPSAGGGAMARTFLNHIHIDGPTAPITANNTSETVTLTPVSDRPNPGLSFSTQFTVTPAARVLGNHISPESPWPVRSATGSAVDSEISNNGTVTMNAHLGLANMPGGITAPTVTDFPFTINDNRQANFLSSWFATFEYSLPGGNRDWFDSTDTVRYVSSSQQFRVSAWLPTGSVNPGLTLSVVSRLKKAGVVVQNNTASPLPFPNNSRSSTPIPFNVTAPATVPVTGEAFDIEVDILDNAGLVLGTKTISFTVMPENIYTEADAIRVATEDNIFFHDNTSATGLLTIMNSRGGIASRVVTAITSGRIVLLPMTARHDSAHYIETTLGSPDPSKIGYFAGTDYSHSTIDVAGAAGFRTQRFPDLGDKVIILNRTQDVVANRKRSDDVIIMLLTHESVHAMDVRPDSGTDIERYKTEFRAYWMDGRYGPPDSGICPVGYAGNCFNATFDASLQPPGPKSRRAREIFNHLYNDPVTYPFVKPAYDSNPDFRQQVDNYIYPDGINLMVSVRLESLRTLIENFTGADFANLRQQVRRYMGLEIPAPAEGILDDEEKAFMRSSRAWRDIVDRKVTVVANQLLLKTDLGIPTTLAP